ncbi:MAG: glycosyltransferase family 4 protein [Bacteroidetes bacterium]|nr:glycosyltransferase family 4 protein [Bacteroidota bacterium]
MKIGLVLPDVPQYSETFFNYKIKGLTASGNEVMLFTGKKNTSRKDLNVISAYPVSSSDVITQSLMFLYVILKTLLKSPKRMKKLLNLESKDGKSFPECLKSVYINSHILNEDLDVLHFGFTTMALKRENTASAMNAKMSISFRGYDINIYPLKNPGCYRKVWENTDKVHTISDYLRVKAITEGLPEKTPFMKITPAIDIKNICQANIRENIAEPRILTVGRLNWIKNYETSISAMKLLADKGIKFTYEIIGEGNELERLKFAVYQLGLEERIIFAGKKDHDEVKDKMQNTDIYIQPSYEEGFCVSVLEAQASGLMCIVSDAEGLRENVIDGETGWVVPGRNFRAFQEKICEVIEMKASDRKKISDNARARVEREFNIEDQNNKFREFFETMLNRAN